MNRVVKWLLKKYHYSQEAVAYALENVSEQCEQWTDNEPDIYSVNWLKYVKSTRGIPHFQKNLPLCALAVDLVLLF